MIHRAALDDPSRREGIRWLAGLAVPLLAAPAVRAQAPSQPGTLPEVTAPASDGTAVLPRDLPASRWRAVWIDIWASWCGPCRLSFPWMNDMHDRYAAAGLRVVAVNVDARAADAQKFLQAHPARFALAMDPTGSVPKLLDAKAMPSSWLVRPDRSVLLAHRGFRLEDRAEMERSIRTALGI